MTKGGAIVDVSGGVICQGGLTAGGPGTLQRVVSGRK